MEIFTFEMLAKSAGIVRLLLFIFFSGVAGWCIWRGVLLFEQSVRQLAEIRAAGPESTQVDVKNLKFAYRGASGLALIVLAIALSIVLLTTDFDFEFNAIQGGNSQRLDLSWLAPSTAAAQSHLSKTSDVHAFCTFAEKRQNNLKVTIKSANGSSLTMPRRRLLSQLNRSANQDGQPTQRQIVNLAKDVLSDRAIVERLRFLLIESIFTNSEIVAGCKTGETEFRQKFEALLNLGR